MPDEPFFDFVAVLFRPVHFGLGLLCYLSRLSRILLFIPQESQRKAK